MILARITLERLFALSTERYRYDGQLTDATPFATAVPPLLRVPSKITRLSSSQMPKGAAAEPRKFYYRFCNIIAFRFLVWADEVAG